MSLINQVLTNLARQNRAKHRQNGRSSWLSALRVIPLKGLLILGLGVGVGVWAWNWRQSSYHTDFDPYFLEKKQQMADVQALMKSYDPFEQTVVFALLKDLDHPTIKPYIPDSLLALKAIVHHIWPNALPENPETIIRKSPPLIFNPSWSTSELAKAHTEIPARPTKGVMVKRKRSSAQQPPIKEVPLRPTESVQARYQKVQDYIQQNTQESLHQALKILEAQWPALAEDPHHYFLLSNVYQGMNQAQKAIPILEGLLNIYPDKAEIWIGLGQALESLGKTQDANRVYQHIHQKKLLKDPRIKSFVQQRLQGNRVRVDLKSTAQSS